jgi:hypothetical protein
MRSGCVGLFSVVWGRKLLRRVRPTRITAEPVLIGNDRLAQCEGASRGCVILDQQDFEPEYAKHRFKRNRPSHGWSGWFSHTQPVSSENKHFTLWL